MIVTKKRIIPILFGFLLCGILLGIAVPKNGVAYAATNSSAVYTTQGNIESKGNVVDAAPTEFYEVTMESQNASGTGTLANHSIIDWTYATFKVVVKNHGHTEHARYTLTRDGEVVSSNYLSGRSSITVCSVELTNGNYDFTYISTYWTARETFNNFPYVFHFTVDNKAPTYELKSGNLDLSSGGNTSKNITYLVKDEHLDKLYYKSPSASTFSSTTKDYYTVEAKESNSGLWQFYAIDTLGQRNGTVSAYLDCKPPKMTLGSGMSFGTTVGQAIKVTASDEISTAKLYVKYESEEWFSQGNSYTIPKTERNGRYYFYAEDGLGNRTDTSWIILSTEDPVGRIVKSESDNSVSFVWDNEYWSATLDGKAYRSGAWVAAEGNHSIVLSNNAEKKKTYTFSIDHYYTVASEKKATCSANGYIRYKCSHCSRTYDETIYSTGHKFSEKSVPASCDSAAEKVYICTACGYSYKEVDENIPSGHSYTSEVIVEPTCTQEGLLHNTCDLCGEVNETKIAPSGHNYEITDVQSSDGNTVRTYTCSVCGETFTQELGDQYEEVSNYIEYLFMQYKPYMVWVLLATAGVWSIAIGVCIAIACKNEDKAKAKKMLINYVIGLVIIFVIIVACPYLVRGIASLIT